MSLGERIRFFRNRQGYTQKLLGRLLGFSEKTADVRIAQYESGTHVPKEAVIDELVLYLKVSKEALMTPDTDDEIGVMHTLFLLEDLYAIKIDKIDKEVCIRLNYEDERFRRMLRLLSSWYEEAAKYRRGEITKDEYDKWRYFYPRYDKGGPFHHLPTFLDEEYGKSKKRKRK
ncbi:MAG: helix-turn-helix transcriptional regulator [Oscillospiraceae bacterium]|nr:helix-turn-helix transcriptional regulator [Oscillospiraceae bacterium]